MSSFAERECDLQELAAAPEATPSMLEQAAWEVIGNALYDGSEEDTVLLPATQPVVERLAKHETLSPLSDMRMNAAILLAHWDILGAHINAPGAPIANKVRRASRRQLADLVRGASSNNFDLDAMYHPVAQKLSEAITLQLLLRNDANSGIYGLPAEPSVHYFQGIDQATNTTSFHLYAIAPGLVVPTFAARLPQGRMEDTDKHRGVLIVPLGELVLLAARAVSPIMQESKAQGSIKAGQRMLTSRLGEVLAHEVATTIEERRLVTQDEAHWLDKITEQLAKNVQRLDATTSFRRSIRPPDKIDNKS